LSPLFSFFLALLRSELLAWFSCCAHEQDPVRSSHFSATDFHLPMKSRSITALVFHATPLLLSCVLEYLSDRVREAEVSDRVKSAEDQMKRIADQVYKVGRRSDEAESRSGYPGRLGIGYGWLRYGTNRNKIAC
jgi:hypothetical protein